MPSIFKRRKILVSRRKRDQGKIGKKIKTPRNSSHEKTGGSRDPEQDGTDEQRLPLKKRHHHLQVGAGVVSLIILKVWNFFAIVGKNSKIFSKYG